jgi:hypothetical protein
MDDGGVQNIVKPFFEHHPLDPKLIAGRDQASLDPYNRSPNPTQIYS